METDKVFDFHIFICNYHVCFGMQTRVSVSMTCPYNTGYLHTLPCRIYSNCTVHVHVHVRAPYALTQFTRLRLGWYTVNTMHCTNGLVDGILLSII